MKRDEALEKLRSYADELKALGVVSLFMFGSTARDEATDSSDLDLYFEYDKSKKFSLFDMLSVKYYLEDHLNIEIDVASKDCLHPRLYNNVTDNSLQVY